MNKKYIYTLVALSIASGLGGYWIYNRIRIAKLNAKVSTLNEAEEAIKNIDTSDIPPEAREPVEPSLPMPTDQPAQLDDSKYIDDNSTDEYYSK